MSAKAKGSRSEHKSRRLLEADGYSVCKAGASLGVWDLIGVRADSVVLVQVKSNRWPGRAEMATLSEFGCPPVCVKLVHRWDDYAKEPKVRVL